MTILAGPASVDRMRAIQAVRNILAGRVSFPLACGYCDGTITYEERSGTFPFGLLVACLKCGRRTTFELAHELRRQKIAAYIRDGAT